MRSFVKPWLITVATITVLLLSAIVFIRQRPRPYDLVALSLADALLAGDMNVVGQHLFEQEVDLAGYTDENLGEVWKQLIGPSLSGAKVVGTERDLSENYGSANHVLKFPDGNSGSLQVVVYATDDGPRMLISPHVYYAWQRRYPGGHSLENSRRAILEGVQSDGDKLEKMGVKGYVSFDIVEMNGPPQFTLKTWDEVRRRVEGHLGIQPK